MVTIKGSPPPRARLTHLGVVFAASVVAANAAAEPGNITPGEKALLPEFCAHTQTFTTDDPRSRFVDSPAKTLYLELGPSYLALHHYCWGLINVRRASTAPMGLARQAMLSTAINDYKYVLANSTPDFVLRPEVLLRLGEAYVESQDYANALDAFRQSREAKPDYWPAYVRAASVYLRLGKHSEALAVLQQGLALMPNEPALRDAYKRMGGTDLKIATKPPATAAPPARAPSRP